ncbi:hypothetical protein C8R46DRAFT_278843 [Mycena filopes]|nr:hypothetical protein C8R46DRAFT_278843 [Mycena filopes]
MVTIRGWVYKTSSPELASNKLLSTSPASTPLHPSFLSLIDFDPSGPSTRCQPIHGHMATMQSTAAKPFLPLKADSPTPSLQSSASPSPAADFESSSSYMPARTSVMPVGMSIAGPSRTSSLAPKRSPSVAGAAPSPPAGSEIEKEIDMFIENIGRLVKQLEDKHSRRSFDIVAPRQATFDSEADGLGASSACFWSLERTLTVTCRVANSGDKVGVIQFAGETNVSVYGCKMLDPRRPRVCLTVSMCGES